MRAFITGICGFAGGFLTDLLLSEGFEVFGIKLPRETIPDHLPSAVNIMDADLTDAPSISRAISACRPDAVFHLAAQSSVALSWKQPKLTFEININGTLTLLEEIKGRSPNCRVLLAGSGEQYGKASFEAMPLPETHPLNPGNPYAVSKAAQEMLGKLYASARDLHIIMTRAFNHTGPRQSPEFVLSDFSRRIALIERGILPPVLETGNLDAIRDFSDVRDMVSGYLALLRLGRPGEVYNIGAGRGYAIRDLLKELLALSGARIEVERDPSRLRPSDVPVLIGDIAKLTAHTGFTPRIPIRQTLNDVLEYWRGKALQGA